MGDPAGDASLFADPIIISLDNEELNTKDESAIGSSQMFGRFESSLSINPDASQSLGASRRQSLVNSTASIQPIYVKSFYSINDGLDTTSSIISLSETRQRNRSGSVSSETPLNPILEARSALKDGPNSEAFRLTNVEEEEVGVEAEDKDSSSVELIRPKSVVTPLDERKHQSVAFMKRCHHVS